MSTKTNCWDLKNCGRESDGVKVAQLGICPAATDESANGINSGLNAGRLCWAVAGTLCEGKVQGSFTDKQMECSSCEVFVQIRNEEGSSFRLLKQGQSVFSKTT